MIDIYNKIRSFLRRNISEESYYCIAFIKNYILKNLCRCFWIFPIQNDKIVFCNMGGDGYGDSPCCVAEELLRVNDFKLFWRVANVAEPLPERIKAIPINHILIDMYQMSTAKVWVSNTRERPYIVKRKKQVYIQIPHGGVIIKKCEKDAEESLGKSYKAMALNDSSMIDVIISDSNWTSNILRRNYYYNGPIWEYGLPRSDVFFSDISMVRSKVLSYYNIEEKKKIILYAPTFRNDERLDHYKLDFKQVAGAATKRFGGEYVLLLRLHPLIRNKQKEIAYDDFLLNGTKYKEMRELICASDILITDYSNTMFDAFRLKTKCFLYADDYKEYTNDERGLYFDLKDMPASFSSNQEELLDSIIKFNQDEYIQKCKDFNDTIKYFDDGNSTKRVVNYIQSMCNI